MKYSDKLNELLQLKAFKTKEYKAALAKYSLKDQGIISFEEVSLLKDELNEITVFIKALKKVFQKPIINK